MSRDEMLHYIDSTFSVPSAKELEKIINDETGSDGYPLIELIFFPDEQIQMIIERLIGDAVFREEDEEKLRVLLMGKKPETLLSLPDGRGVLTVSMPRYAVEGFVSRLNITRLQDRVLVEKINNCIDDEAVRLLVKVKLRNARFYPDKENFDFLLEFFEKMPSEEKTFFMHFDFVLSFLHEHRPGNNMLQELIEAKEILSASLYRAGEYEKALAKNNIETMLLRGVRNPGINKDECLSHIEMINRLVRAVFGE